MRIPGERVEDTVTANGGVTCGVRGPSHLSLYSNKGLTGDPIVPKLSS